MAVSIFSFIKGPIHGKVRISYCSDKHNLQLLLMLLQVPALLSIFHLTVRVGFLSSTSQMYVERDVLFASSVVEAQIVDGYLVLNVVSELPI